MSLTAWLCTTGVALAAPKDAGTCAAGLNPKAREIYDNVAPGLKPGDDLRGAMTMRVMPLVMTAELTRSDAEAAAPAAAACLELLQRPVEDVAQR